MAGVEFEDGRYAEYSFKQLEELELAYAITIHKSQGSEYPAVVMPLLSGPKMLLLDEPVAGLDPKVTREMYELIYKLNREDGITVIMVSHDIAAAVKYATHILHVSHTPLFFGKKEDYIKTDTGKAFTSEAGDENE